MYIDWLENRVKELEEKFILLYDGRMSYAGISPEQWDDLRQTYKNLKMSKVEKIEITKTEPPVIWERSCPICKGTGEVQQSDVDWDDCRMCEGRGKI